MDTDAATHPLLLKRVKDQAELDLKRPQNPAQPFPYRDEEVTYDNKAQNVTLAATLTILRAKDRFQQSCSSPAPARRIATRACMGHKPFLVLADYLTRHGVAVLRADDRGTAKSTGNFKPPRPPTSPPMPRPASPIWKPAPKSISTRSA